MTIALPTVSASVLDMYVEWPDGDSGFRLRTGIDPATRLVMLATGGVWSPDDVERFRAIQSRINEVARARYGRLDIMIDLRRASVVPQKTSEKMQSLKTSIYLPTDRQAFVMASALMRMQLKRTDAVGIREVFETVEAARAWLLSA